MDHFEGCEIHPSKIDIRAMQYAVCAILKNGVGSIDIFVSQLE